MAREMYPKAFYSVVAVENCDIKLPGNIYIHQIVFNRSALNNVILWPSTAEELDSNLRSVAKLIDSANLDQLVASFDDSGLVEPCPLYYRNADYEYIVDPQHGSELPSCLWSMYEWLPFEEIIKAVKHCDPSLVFKERSYEGLRFRRLLSHSRMKQLLRVLPDGIVVDIQLHDAVMMKTLLSMVLQVAANLRSEAVIGDGLVDAGWQKVDGGYAWIDMPCSDAICNFIIGEESCERTRDADTLLKGKSGNGNIQCVTDERTGGYRGVRILGSWKNAAQCYLDVADRAFAVYRMPTGVFEGVRSSKNGSSASGYSNRYGLWFDLMRVVLEGDSAGWEVRRCSCGRSFLAKDATRPRHKCRNCCPGNTYAPQDCLI